MGAAMMEAVREPLVLHEVPKPECLHHGALVRVEAHGVCRSDCHG